MMIEQLKKYFIEFQRKYGSSISFEKTYYWKIDTSIISILEKFKNFIELTGDSKLRLFEINGRYSFFEKQNQDLNGGKSIKAKTILESAVSQYLQVGFIYGIFKTELSIFDKKMKFRKLLRMVLSKELELEFKSEFLHANNVRNYFDENWQSIFSHQKQIFEIGFDQLKTNTNNLMFTHFLYMKNKRNEIDDIEIITILKDRINPAGNKTDITNWSEDAWYQLSGVVYQELVFYGESLTIDERNKKFENEFIGQIGEYVFNYFARDKSKFIEKIDSYKDEVSLIDFSNDNVVWESKLNKFAPYDFKIDEFYFEVKTSNKPKIEREISFNISHKEYQHILTFPSHSFICRISNIDHKKWKESDIYRKRENINTILLAEDAILKLVKLIDIQNENKFEMHSKGYFFNEK